MYIHIYIYIHVCVYICVYICAYMCVCICMCSHICIYTHIHTYIYTYVYKHTLTHICPSLQELIRAVKGKWTGWEGWEGRSSPGMGVLAACPRSGYLSGALPTSGERAPRPAALQVQRSEAQWAEWGRELKNSQKVHESVAKWLSVSSGLERRPDGWFVGQGEWYGLCAFVDILEHGSDLTWLPFIFKGHWLLCGENLMAHLEEMNNYLLQSVFLLWDQGSLNKHTSCPRFQLHPQ
jgi:hypothetical protein